MSNIHHRDVEGVGAVDLRIKRFGSGTPVLFLHPELGFYRAAPFLDLLAREHTVVAPAHPGFEGSSRPSWFDHVDDLAYLYLDLLKRDDLREVTVVGVGLGAWIALELAVRDTSRLSALVLAGPVGVKFGGATDRDISDVFVLGRDAVNALAFADPALAPVVAKGEPEAELLSFYQNREASALYGWSPYMHTPKLAGRLHRIDVPTAVVWGEADGIVSREYATALARAISGGRLVTIAGAGHFPHIERPAELATIVATANGTAPQDKELTS